MKELFLSLILFISFNLVFISDVLSWDNTVTHKDLSEFAAENSVLSKNKGDYLKNLGFYKELLEEFKWGEIKKTVKDWLREGGDFEDNSDPLFPIYGTTRSFNHFHNPLKPWDQAGLNDYWTGKSSLLWAQDGVYQQNFPEGDWSWQKARLCYYYALIPQTDDNRQAFFACTFRGLGHQMHLIQDAAQPDHVRNDAHPEDAIFGKNRLNGGRYFETWAKERFRNLNELKAFAPNPVFPNVPFNVSYNGLVPITQLIDTDLYDGLNASAGINQGIAEYTNANFFSGDTIFAAERYQTTDSHYFPYPKRSSTDLQSFIAGAKPAETIINEDGNTDTGMWISKISDGEAVGHFARTSYLSNKVYALFGEGALFYSTFYRDEECHKDYAKLLIPRAVGYSAGLLNYFFRGNIEISLPNNGVYALTSDPNQGFTKITLLAKNTTSTGEEMPDGSIELVVKYKEALEDPFQSYPVPTTNESSYKVVPELNNIRSIPNDTPVELTFDLSQNKIPINATDVYLQLVYKGRLGNEDGAVAVGMKDISEPTPIDLFNNMDKICLNANWYVAGSAEAIAQVDTNNNGILEPEWDIYPHNIKDAYLKISTTGNPINASPTDYTFYTPSITAGNLYRAYVLSDYDYQFNCSNHATVIKTTPDDTFTHASDILTITWSGAAIKNQVDYHVEQQSECDTIGATAPCDIRYYPLFYTFRNKKMWGPAGYIIDNPKYPSDTNCPWELLKNIN